MRTSWKWGPHGLAAFAATDQTRNLPWGSPDKTNLPRSAKICGDRQNHPAKFTSSDLLQSGRRGNLHGAQPPDTAHGLQRSLLSGFRFPVSAANDLDLSLLFPASKISFFSIFFLWCVMVLKCVESVNSILGPPSLFFGRPEFSNHPFQPKNTHTDICIYIMIYTVDRCGWCRYYFIQYKSIKERLLSHVVAFGLVLCLDQEIRWKPSTERCHWWRWWSSCRRNPAFRRGHRQPPEMTRPLMSDMSDMSSAYISHKFS